MYKNALIMQCRCRHSDVQVEGALCFPLVLYNNARLISHGLIVTCGYFRTKQNKISYTLERTMSLICHVYIQVTH